MTYKFEQFKTEIVDPTIEIIKINDSISDRVCDVEILLIDASKSKFGINLSGFQYQVSWEDQDVYDWVIDELNKYSDVVLKSKKQNSTDEKSFSEKKGLVAKKLKWYQKIIRFLKKLLFIK